MDARIVDGEHVTAAEIENDVIAGLMGEISEMMSLEESAVERQAIARNAEVGDGIPVESGLEDEGVGTAAAPQVIVAGAAGQAIRTRPAVDVVVGATAED